MISTSEAARQLRHAARKFFLEEAIMPHEPATKVRKRLYFTRIADLEKAALAYATSLGYKRSRKRK